MPIYVNPVHRSAGTDYPDGANDDTSHYNYPVYGVALHTSPYPMANITYCEFRKPNRRPSQSDVDVSPYPIRRFTNMSVTDVQLNNGLRYGVAKGRRIGYRGTGYLWNVSPIIPGQMRDNAAGYHRKGPSPYTLQDVWAAGPGAQPEHPGGPGKIAAPTFINPMSG